MSDSPNYTLIYSETFTEGFPRVGFWNPEEGPLMVSPCTIIGPVGPAASELIRMVEALAGDNVRVPAAIAIREVGALAIQFSALDTGDPQSVNPLPEDEEFVWSLLAYGPSLEDVRSCHIVQLKREVIISGDLPLHTPMYYQHGSKEEPTEAERLLRASTINWLNLSLQLAAEDGNHPFFLLSAFPPTTDRLLHKLGSEPYKSVAGRVCGLILRAMCETALTCIRHGRG